MWNEKLDLVDYDHFLFSFDLFPLGFMSCISILLLVPLESLGFQALPISVLLWAHVRLGLLDSLVSCCFLLHLDIYLIISIIFSLHYFPRLA